jgi:hypothetical protein
MYQALRITWGRSLSRLKAIASVKSVYTLAFALLLASGILLAFPPPSALAANCSASCAGGSSISVTNATSCSCTDNAGCTWTTGGSNYASSCASPPPGGGGEFEIEQGPQN